MTGDEIECIEEGGTGPTIALLRRLAGSQARDTRRPTVKWRVVRAWNEAERDGPP